MIRNIYLLVFKPYSYADASGEFPVNEFAVKLRNKFFKGYSKKMCLPLYSILLAFGNPPVDYWSLDVEGAELGILKTIPWDKVDIKVTPFVALQCKSI